RLPAGRLPTPARALPWTRKGTRPLDPANFFMDFLVNQLNKKCGRIIGTGGRSPVFPFRFSLCVSIFLHNIKAGYFPNTNKPCKGEFVFGFWLV
ncbi:MAG: hypothetical protein FWG68_02230, partial [Defluviitaleaceae bacterium]|nr:hypothetical protein [Defluviitaleaceae bacterium]